jgi:N-acetylmuramic acid 6-phosphate etherase
MRPTEERHRGTTDLHRRDTADVVRAIHEADATVPAAVAAALPVLVEAVELAITALRSGGRVHYFGSGSSGRYGVLDAAELPPTYGLPPDRFVAHLAGGTAALVRSVEGAEDDEAAGAADAGTVTAADLAVGLTASGRTPYVGGALRAARRAGARTVLVSSDPDAVLAPLADVHVLLDTGPEVIMGSTRMKAGTALKMTLHTFSTAVMVRLGRTYSNLMVEVAGSNSKLRERRLRILREATGAAPDRCADALRAADGDLKTAIVAVLAGCPPQRARTALREAGGVVGAALAGLGGAG